MLVASAVFPIDGLLININKSDLCNPPRILSKSKNPEDTPNVLSLLR